MATPTPVEITEQLLTTIVVLLVISVTVGIITMAREFAK